MSTAPVPTDRLQYDNARVAGLLARGGWEIITPDEASAQSGQSDLPPVSEERVRQLQPGDLAFLPFRMVDHVDEALDGLPVYNDQGLPNLGLCIERMWVTVEQTGDRYVGVLDNSPYASLVHLSPGARVEFDPTCITDIIPRDDLEYGPPPGMPVHEALAMRANSDPGYALHELDWARHELHGDQPRRLTDVESELCVEYGARPERPHALARCLVATDIGEQAMPLCGVRFKPEVENQDSGWVFWAGDKEWSDYSYTLHTLEHAFRLLPKEMRHMLALPPKWAFQVDAAGNEDVWFDPYIDEDDDFVHELPAITVDDVPDWFDDVLRQQLVRSEQTYAALLEHGVQEGQLLPRQFVYRAPDETAARALVRAVQSMTGASPETVSSRPRRLGRLEWSVAGWSEPRPSTLLDLATWSEWMTTAGARHGCRLDGWGVGVD